MKSATGRAEEPRPASPCGRPVAEHDRERRTEARACGHPGKSRIGEGVAEEALHECAGNRKRRANHYAENKPRQPDMDDDEGILCWIDTAPSIARTSISAARPLGTGINAMRERQQCDEGQKRDERSGSQKDPAAAIGLEADLVDRDAHCRSARVGSGGSVKPG